VFLRVLVWVGGASPRRVVFFFFGCLFSVFFSFFFFFSFIFFFFVFFFYLFLNIFFFIRGENIWGAPHTGRESSGLDSFAVFISLRAGGVDLRPAHA